MLSVRLNELFAHAPQTSATSYKKAEKALGTNEALTFSDKEIDRMLPRELRYDTAPKPDTKPKPQ